MKSLENKEVKKTKKKSINETIYWKTPRFCTYQYVQDLTLFFLLIKQSENQKEFTMEN